MRMCYAPYLNTRHVTDWIYPPEDHPIQKLLSSESRPLQSRPDSIIGRPDSRRLRAHPPKTGPTCEGPTTAGPKTNPARLRDAPGPTTCGQARSRGRAARYPWTRIQVWRLGSEDLSPRCARSQYNHDDVEPLGL